INGTAYRVSHSEFSWLFSLRPIHYQPFAGKCAIQGGNLHKFIFCDGTPPCRMAVIEASDAFDDAEVAIRSRAEDVQGGLVGRAIVSVDGFLETLELRHDQAFLQTGLASFHQRSSNDEFAAPGFDCGDRKLAVLLQRVLVGDVTVHDN